ncbi:AAA domain-containing protein [Dickeya fangzhongdai]|uniref:AAA domain-containing protein n=1 Tax=Dickeya fangzhongdai TaxID=1778540 RepID=UPI0009B898BD|nr:AAA domain-containing protein [Dickeya fangzhongdai]
MQDISSVPFFTKFTEQICIRNYDFEFGNPGLLAAEVNGRQVIVKFWLNRHQDHTEILKEIWLYEKRQLQRLKGCLGVGDYISPIYESYTDEFGFYLVLDSGSRLPLSHYYELTSGTLQLKRTWIFNLRQISNRLRFWKNIKRIVSAINILHSQGLLHRHLNFDSILTDPTNELDFQLTGFEWSIRVQRMQEPNLINESTEISRKHFSFLTDWMDLGYLIAKILKVSKEQISDTQYPIHKIIDQTELTINEIIFIRGLIGVIDIDKSLSSKVINADIALIKIEDIIKELNNLLERSPNPLAIALLFNTSASKGKTASGITSVFNAVQQIFFDNHSIYLADTDISELLEFISKDLVESSITKIQQNNGEIEYLLIGRQLSYIIGKNKSSRQDIEGDWNTAFCHSAYLTPPVNLGQRNQKVQINRKVECFVHTNKSELQRINPSPWNEYIEKLELPATRDEVAKDLTTGFAAYHLTEIAFAKAENYPVEVVSYRIDEDDSSLFNVKLRTRIDPEAETVSQSLSIKSPAVRLKQIFKDSGEFSKWIFLSNSNFNDEDHEIVLDFLSKKTDNGEIIYEFTTNSPNPDYKNPFIITSSTLGTISQLSRRAAAIDALSQHNELAELLKFPHRMIMNSSENLAFHKSFDGLDDSKKDVFQKVLNTLPLYLVQGPPGVGKTYLVTTLVQQFFEIEPNSRLLLTAQSHATVHHLYNEVSKALKSHFVQDSQLLVISCVKNGSSDNDADPNLKVDELAREQINNLLSSSLFNSCPSDGTKNRVIALSHISNRSGRSSLVNQLLKSANLVFATTNSKQVEDLIKSSSQFDWSIMEETGKVTGLELLSPMLLSHRRLMIGDHKQLPPYASEVMRKVLGNPDNLKKSLQFSQDIYNNNIKGEFVKNKLTQESVDSFSEQDIEGICNNALRMHLLFETLIKEEDIASKKSIEHYGHKGRHKPIASMLEIQHRMHPTIAEVISEVFYDHKLDTSDEKKEFYTNKNRPFYFETNNFEEINSAPIIWIETPDIQANLRVRSGDKMPQWHNPFEAEIVVNLLKLLRKKSDAHKLPKLALLAPYNKQIERISTLLEKENNNIKNLNDFSKPDDSSSFCSTVDAFQGAEADLTIISLVRNNSDSYPLSALGILLDSRRMNVLLSRAKHQLIIVGSYEFLKHWSEKIQREEVSKGNARNEFLCKLVSKLDSLKLSKNAVFISSNKTKIAPYSYENSRKRKNHEQN